MDSTDRQGAQCIRQVSCMAMLENVRIVLVNTTHPGNIGASARAMKTMGLSSLWLVNPHGFPSAEATAMASGADDLLDQARVVQSLDEALEGVGWVLGTSARMRSLPWPMLDPVEAGDRLAHESQRHPVAVLFGRERYGLTNDELKRCHFLVRIPSNPDFSSLNLAASVQIMAYEVYRKMPSRPAISGAPHQAAPSESLEGFYIHLEETLREIGFLKGPAEKMLLRLRRLFNRARPDHTEINILRGILSDTQRLAELNRRQLPPDKKGALGHRKAAQQEEDPHGGAGQA